MDKREIIVRSDKSELIRFRESLLAKDIRRELMRWCKDVMAMYPETETMLEKGRVDGRLEAVQYVLGIIDVMIMVKEEKDDGIRRNETE